MEGKKKLKAWQIVLMIIFYPITLTYLLIKFIIKIVKKNKSGQIIKYLNTTVVGVTFANKDGTSRQEIILSCTEGEELEVRHYDDAEFPSAFGVFKKNGQQLGHISRELADDLYAFYRENPMYAIVTGITGGGKLTYGCNIRLFILNK